MIKQVIVVEGKSDIARVSLAVEADMIATGGLGLSDKVIEQIRCAYERRGIIILTDPDGPGNHIRQKLTRLFPDALQAFVPKAEASTSTDVGIEDASPEAISRALANAHALTCTLEETFTMSDLIRAGMAGGKGAAARREKAAEKLHIGYGNARSFLKKLNHFNVTREDWERTISEMEDTNA